MHEQIIQYVGTIIIGNVPLRKMATRFSKYTKREAPTPQIHHCERLISKPCCRLMTVKSDHRDHSSFISTVTSCHSSNLQLPFDFPEKPARRTDSNKVSHTLELGCSSYSLNVSHIVILLRAAPLPPQPPTPSLKPHVFLSLRQESNYMLFIELHSIFKLILLNIALNKWLVQCKGKSLGTGPYHDLL